ALWSSTESAGVPGSLTITGTPPVVPDLPDRIFGSDRYATAAAVATEWDESFDADVVFLATGENYPDALSAAAAAAYRGAPVLLTKKNSLPPVVKSKLQQLAPSKVVVLGSTAAISASVFSTLTSMFG